MAHQATPIGKHSSGNLLFKDTLPNQNSKSVSPPRERRCLRRGCSHRFLPKKRNQRFCKVPSCELELKRWKNLKRQRKRRQDPVARARDAESQKQRRELNRIEVSPEPLLVEAEPLTSGTPKSPEPPALSHRTRIPKDFCDRPGCFDPKAISNGNTPKYCGSGCRNAVHRARQRTRSHGSSIYGWPKQTVNSSGPQPSHVSLSPSQGSNIYDPKTNSCARPRSPPSENRLGLG